MTREEIKHWAESVEHCNSRNSCAGCPASSHRTPCAPTAYSALIAAAELLDAQEDKLREIEQHCAEQEARITELNRMSVYAEQCVVRTGEYTDDLQQHLSDGWLVNQCHPVPGGTGLEYILFKEAHK